MSDEIPAEWHGWLDEFRNHMRFVSSQEFVEDPKIVEQRRKDREAQRETAERIAARRRIQNEEWEVEQAARRVRYAPYRDAFDLIVAAMPHPALAELAAFHVPEMKTYGMTLAECCGCNGDYEYGRDEWPCHTISLLAASVQIELTHLTGNDGTATTTG